MARTKYYDETDGIWKYADTSGGTGPGGAVNSVNGKTGDVYLTAADVKARPDDWNPVVTTTIAPHGAGSKADMTASEIINAARKGVVLADYTDPKTGELRTYQYFKQMPDGRACFAINGYIEAGTPKQTLIYVDYAGNVTTETRDATAAGVGAAPEGFGLGKQKGTVVDNLDNAVKNGWYFGAPKDPAHLNTFGYSAVLVNSMGDGDVEQTAYLTARTSDIRAQSAIIHRLQKEGVWQPWEWENPPMYPGIEYRTTEKYNGKPVYVEAITVKAPLNSSVTVYPDFGPSEKAVTIDYGVSLRSKSGYTTVAPYDQNNTSVIANMSGSNIVITIKGAGSADDKLYIWVKYYKEV